MTPAEPMRIRPLVLVGRFVTILGAAFTGAALAKQWKVPTVTQLHYWDWMTIGLLVMIVGLIILLAAKSRTQV